MAVRTNSEDVLAVMGNPTVDEDVVTSLIEAASAVIDKVFENDGTLSRPLMISIEKFFAAHIIASTDLARATRKEKIGDAAVEYSGKFGERLLATSYGQVVLTLDTTGKMAKAGKAGASIYAVKSFEE